ncbi:hypothetical protein CVT24_010093 [Panaeolus cyanescens]|uniref:CCHC-type domain-containing protein n=1 Tax=Panaeolus cyanescens TaxID=181874 RepID=A0A409YQ39_9AGAR|nr:hypothetical protein CVT24_010093 [Panaeolus cyanescens]
MPAATPKLAIACTSDATHPSVELITVNIPFQGEKLDKGRRNWLEWKAEMYSAMSLTGLYSYVNGTANKHIPNPETEPVAYANWTQNDRRACAYIFGAISDGERRAVIPVRHDARAYWLALEARHWKNGTPADQVLLLHEALTFQPTQYASSEDTMNGLDKMFTTIDHAFAMGDITPDMFKAAMSLHFFQGSDPMQDTIRNRIVLSAMAQWSVTARSLRQTIEEGLHLAGLVNLTSHHTEQHDLSSPPSPATPSSARSSTSMSSGGQSSSSRRRHQSCANCGRRGHPARYCVEPNGGMAGCTLEDSKAARQLEKSVKAQQAQQLQQLQLFQQQKAICYRYNNNLQ